ncbi:MAG: S1C family serine protease [Thermoanaerobaculia bacterium]
MNLCAALPAPSRHEGRLFAFLAAFSLVGAPPFGLADDRVQTPPGPACQESVPDLYQRVSPAVVSITATSINPYDSFDRIVRQAGSGVLVDSTGLVLTNSHVVFGQQILMVTLDDGLNLPAQLVGADPILDIALVRIAPPASGPLPFAKLGDSEHLLVGEEVYAIGNPFGLEQTLTRGIVSAVNRILPGGSWSVREPLIQTDAAINHGSSGGPLVNRCGDVIGINTAILPEAQNIGFAIPVHLVKNVMPSLMLDGRVIRPWIGIQGQVVSPPLKELLRTMLADGLLVEVVEPNSPAGKAGVRGGGLDLVIGGDPVLIGGDIITEINGIPVGNPEGLNRAISTLKVGNPIRLRLFREKQTLDVEMVVVERPLLPGDISPRRTVAPAGDGPQPGPAPPPRSSRRTI